MTESLDAREFQSRLQRLDALLREVEDSADPAAAARTREIVQAVLDLHGTGLERILGHLEAAGEAGAPILDACAGDDVVGGLLLLHGLHPLDLEARVLRALEQVRPALRSHGGNVELLGVRDGVGPPPARGELPRLPLVGRDHEDDDRGSHLRQCPRGDLDRGPGADQRPDDDARRPGAGRALGVVIRVRQG